MSDLGKIKPLYPIVPARPVNKDSSRKEKRKDKREGKADEQDVSSKMGKINEYI
ncbi:MAG: hypothetical protein RIB78_06440 [Gammaproteobacteria bacterium]